MGQKTMLKSKLSMLETEMGIKLIKDTFEVELSKALHLTRVTAPKFLVQGTGLQDDLARTQTPVSFKIKEVDEPIEFVHSLAKWKRYVLGEYGFTKGRGIYTDMDAVRKDEVVDEIHSIYVDQWDWERVISKEDRTLDFLKGVVVKIFFAMKKTQSIVLSKFPHLSSTLPEKITFIHTEDLEKMYPDLSIKEREYEITKKHGAVFLIGIGHPLRSGKPHDVRAADYDDWSTQTKPGYRGINGDILVWDSARGKSLEISSMGIRVDSEAMALQLEMAGLKEYETFKFHKAVLDESLPLTIGGGIGQSRLCMFLLEKKHIGEVQSSVWPKRVKEQALDEGLILL